MSDVWQRLHLKLHDANWYLKRLPEPVGFTDTEMKMLALAIQIADRISDVRDLTNKQMIEGSHDE